VASDPAHDLAVLKIVERADETPIPAGTVFPSVAVGDSNQMLPGDGIVIVGYPGISGSTVTFTSGTMSGWVGEDFETGGKQWIKTDAKIAHGNSGEAAFTVQGELIGVPTARRTVQYSELDVEEQAYVRPIGLAWALIGPNVITVLRSGGGAPGSSVAQSAPSTPATLDVPTTTSGTVGALQPGQSAEGRLDGVDVFNLLGAGVMGSYTLEVR
jgi:S1-C subfamily serine protease